MKKTKNPFFITVSFLVLIIVFSSFSCFGERYLLGEKVSALGDSGGQDIVIYLGSDKGRAKETIKEFKSIKRDYSDHGIVVVDGSELSRIKDKKNKKEIIAYNHNQEYKTFLSPDDTYYSQQWALSKIGAPEAWDKATGSNEIVVAVLDTGFVLDHEDLAGRFVEGRDVVDNDSDPSLPAGGGTAIAHGTLVSGIIAGIANNSKGVAGLDWNVKIMPIRVMDNNGNGNTATVAAGINYAFNNGADIINMSLGGDSGDSVLESAINNAYSSGITLVAASGNDGRLGVSYPAKYQNVIAVGSSDSNDFRAPSSNYGPELDVVAPGVSIMTTATSWNGSSYTTNQYGSASGTSLAAPYVSATVSLLLTQGALSPEQIKDRITSSADKVSGMNGENRTDYYGYGRVNVYKSMEGTVTTIGGVAGISLNSFRVTMEDTSNPDSYVLARYPAVGEPVSVRPSLKNDNDYSIVLENLKIRGTLSSGTKFIVGTVPSLTLPANSITAVPVQSFNITSFYTHTFSIDYEIDGKLAMPYVKPTYSYQQIKAHFPNIRVVKTPAFVPSSVDPYQTIIGVYKIKNFDDRPAYLRSVMLRAELGKYLFYFKSDAAKINPGEVYYYQASIIPFRQGIYDAYAHIIYGNGSQRIPNPLLSTSSYSNFTVK